MLTIFLMSLLAGCVLSLASATEEPQEPLFWSSAASFTTVRLMPGDDIMESLLQIVETYKLRAANIVTCVGSVKKAHLRLASASKDKASEYLTTRENDYHEIVSLVGTLELENHIGTVGEEREKASPYAHLHISLADRKGNVIGGHLMPGCIVYTTVEITIMELNKHQYKRETCQLSGYEELSVSKRPTSDISFLGQ